MLAKQMVWLFGGLLLTSTVALPAHERIVDTQRQPYNLADGLLRGWPKPGEWVTYHVTVQPPGDVDGPADQVRFIMQAELIPIRVGEDVAVNLHWLEITFREDARSPPIYVIKLLVDRTKAKPAEWNLAQQKLVGWERRGDAEPTLFGEETIKASEMLQTFILPMDGKWEKLAPADVPYKSGKLRCDQFRRTLREDEGEAVFVSQFNAAIPFGCVRLTGEMEANGRFDFHLADDGTGARSDLPDKDYQALAADLAAEDAAK